MPNVIFTMDNGSSYLAHYGVKGMKWGVRRYQNEDGSLTPLGKKRMGYRDKTVNNIKSNIRRSEEDKKRAKAALKDISKNGISSQHIRDLYYNNPDFQEGLVDVKDRDRDLWDDETSSMRPLNTLSKGVRKEIVARAKEHFSYDADYSSDRERKIIKNIESTPIYKRSYAEALHGQHRVEAGAAIVGGLLPVVGAVAISRLNGNDAYETAGSAAKAALFVSPVTALGGALASPDSANKYYNRNIADPSERRTRRR